MKGLSKYTIDQLEKELKKRRNAPFKKVLEVVDKEYNIKKNVILSRKVNCRISDARQLIFYILRNHYKYKFHEISEFMDRNHATVMYGIKTAQNLMETDPVTHIRYKRIMKKLGKR